MAVLQIMHARPYGTYAEMIAYTGPKGRGNEFLVTDYGVGAGLIFEWNGSAWVLPGRIQVVARTATPVAASGTSETLLFTANYPPLGISDGGMLRFGVNFTNPGNTNLKTVTTKLAGTAIWTQGYNNANHVGLTHDVPFRNRGATNSQVSGHNNANVYGTGPSQLSTSTIQTNVATALTLHGTKAVSGDTLEMEFADALVWGGTALP
jgi:hypothetical protein